MMRYLLCEDRDACDGPLAGLSEDRVEGFSDFGVAGKHEDERDGDVLDLLFYAILLEGFVHERRDESKVGPEGFCGRIIIKDLDRQGHGHDGFAAHQVGCNLFDD